MAPSDRQTAEDQQNGGPSVGAQRTGMVPQTVPELFWRLVFFFAGAAFAVVL